MRLATLPGILPDPRERLVPRHGELGGGGRRHVVDIGGASTEFIIGAGFKPQKHASLYMGCVSYSLEHFPD